MQSKLITTKKALELNGYKPPPHFVGLLNNDWQFCNNGCGYTWHTLYVKTSNDIHYICDKCNCAVTYVG